MNPEPIPSDTKNKDNVKYIPYILNLIFAIGLSIWYVISGACRGYVFFLGTIDFTFFCWLKTWLYFFALSILYFFLWSLLVKKPGHPKREKSINTVTTLGALSSILLLLYLGVLPIVKETFGDLVAGWGKEGAIAARRNEFQISNFQDVPIYNAAGKIEAVDISFDITSTKPHTAKIFAYLGDGYIFKYSYDEQIIQTGTEPQRVTFHNTVNLPDEVEESYLTQGRIGASIRIDYGYNLTIGFQSDGSPKGEWSGPGLGWPIYQNASLMTREYKISDFLSPINIEEIKNNLCRRSELFSRDLDPTTGGPKLVDCEHFFLVRRNNVRTGSKSTELSEIYNVEGKNIGFNRPSDGYCIINGSIGERCVAQMSSCKFDEPDLCKGIPLDCSTDQCNFVNAERLSDSSYCSKIQNQETQSACLTLVHP